MSKQQVELEAVFRLKPNRTDDEIGECDIKLVGYVSPTDKLGDEPLEIQTTKNEIKVVSKDTLLYGRIEGYDITINAYRNNIIGNYLIKNRNLPVCSLQYMYSKNIVIGYLFNIFIYFSLDLSKNYYLKTPKDYVGARIYGKYIMSIDSDKELVDGINNLTDSDLEKYALEDIAEHMNDKNYTESELVEMIKKNVEEKKEFYKMLVKGKEVKYTKNIKKMAEDNLYVLFKNKHMNGLIKYALEIRAKKRIKEYGAYDGVYKIPERVLKLDDIRNNPDCVDKFIEEN
jgi:hypothetical protein